MDNWFCAVFNVVCVVNFCRSELIDSAWVVIVPGQKCIKNYDKISLKFPNATKEVTEEAMKEAREELHQAPSSDNPSVITWQ